jgi:hypothetical protein
MTAVIAGGMAAPPLAPPPALQQLLPQAQAPLPAARLDAYTKVMRIFLQGSYDLVGGGSCTGAPASPAGLPQQPLRTTAPHSLARAQHGSCT